MTTVGHAVAVGPVAVTGPPLGDGVGRNRGGNESRAGDSGGTPPGGTQLGDGGGTLLSDNGGTCSSGTLGSRTRK